jgi:hypothetical protein
MPPHATDGPEAPALRHPGASPWEVADIFCLYGATYRRTHPVPPAQQQVMHAIEACRTAQLGGHAEPCPTCGFERYAYNPTASFNSLQNMLVLQGMVTYPSWFTEGTLRWSWDPYPPPLQVMEL